MLDTFQRSDMVVIISISKDFIVVLILAQWIECEKCDAFVTI